MVEAVTHNVAPLIVDPADRVTLSEWADTGMAGDAVARRARIVLLSGDGLGPSAVAAEVGCSTKRAIRWRERYRTDGLAGLRDAPRSGRPASVDEVAVVAHTLQPPPPRLRVRRWSSRLLGAELGISNVAVANVWRRWGVAPAAAGRVRLCTEPELDEPVVAVIGLYAARSRGVMLFLAGEGDEHGRVPSTPVGHRPRLGRRFTDLDLGDASADDVRAFSSFLAAFDDVPPPGLCALTSGVGEAVGDWAQRHGAAEHRVPEGLSWPRLVRVACVLAGETAAGAASVSDLRRAVDGHVPGGPLSWTYADRLRHRY